MNGLPLPWKLFRILCILQLILVLFLLVLNGASLFGSSRSWTHAVALLSYAAVFLFLCQGLAILNDNYPSTPLSQPQKRRFNLLYLVNFLLIAFLFAKTVGAWELLPYLSIPQLLKNHLVSNFIFYMLQTIMVFLFHLVFLYGMYRLRKQIHDNALNDNLNNFLADDGQ